MLTHIINMIICIACAHRHSAGRPCPRRIGQGCPCRVRVRSQCWASTFFATVTQSTYHRFNLDSFPRDTYGGLVSTTLSFSLHASLCIFILMQSFIRVHVKPIHGFVAILTTVPDAESSRLGVATARASGLRRRDRRTDWRPGAKVVLQKMCIHIYIYVYIYIYICICICICICI